MRLKDVPKAPAYLVYHDAYDGAMDVYAYNNYNAATKMADKRNDEIDAHGNEGCGIWRAYLTLPRRKIWKFTTLQS